MVVKSSDKNLGLFNIFTPSDFDKFNILLFSLETTISSKYLLFRAPSIVYWIKGFRLTNLIFLFRILLLLPLAGIIAKILFFYTL